jgi:hypothetical protein
MVGMAYIRALHDVEDEGQGRAPAALKKLRQRKSKPILAKLKGWLNEQGPAALPKSLIASCGRHKKNPFEYLRDVLRRFATHSAKEILNLTPARWKPKSNTS